MESEIKGRKQMNPGNGTETIEMSLEAQQEELSRKQMNPGNGTETIIEIKSCARIN